MLAQNFKTPAELGLSDAEFDALAKVLGILERQEVPHADDIGPAGSVAFNMHFHNDTLPGCGTIACIKGHAEIISDGVAFPEQFWTYKYDNPKLFDLFCPDWGINRHRISTGPAAIALRSYLTTGEANWAEALA